MEINDKKLEEKAAAVLAKAKANDSQSGPTDGENITPVSAIPHTDEKVAIPKYTSEELDQLYGFNPDEAGEDTAYAMPQTPPANSIDEPSDDEYIYVADDNAKPTQPEDETILLSNVARENMPNSPTDYQNDFLSGLMPDIQEYKKDLIINHGMTMQEATNASISRVKVKAIEADRKWAEEHPNGVILTIDKSKEDSIEFTDEERGKIFKADAIKLVMVDSQELLNIKINRCDKAKKMSQLRDITGAMSHYSVPLLDTGDYATFRGAQTSALLNAITDEDDTWLDMLEKKASVLYRYFNGSTTFSRMKRNDKGEMIPITYEDFCNWYHYADMDMGIYAIVVASAMEQTKSTYRCQNRNCNQFFDIVYNNKTMLDLSNLPEAYKVRLEVIDNIRTSYEKMITTAKKWGDDVRIKSPFSKNIFELHAPTIAEARHRVSEALSVMNEYNALNLFMLLYTNKLYIYDASTDSYLEYDVDEDPADAYTAIENIHQIDLDIINRYINENLFYQPEFKIAVECPFCKRKAVDALAINSMLFLHARASSTEIQI